MITLFYKIFVFNKNTGLTSNNYLIFVKNKMTFKSGGYYGTLDPLAAGILPICLFNNTKFLASLSMSNKQYIVKFRLGIKTMTEDLDGKILAINLVPKKLYDNALISLLIKFVYKLTFQYIPNFSSKKINGLPMYKIFRYHSKISKIKKYIKIYYINILDYNDSIDEFTLNIYCSSGTYMRSFINYIGDILKCSAFVIKIYRARVCSYDIFACTVRNLMSKHNQLVYLTTSSVLTTYDIIKLKTSSIIALINFGFLYLDNMCKIFGTLKVFQYNFFLCYGLVLIFPNGLILKH